MMPRTTSHAASSPFLREIRLLPYNSVWSSNGIEILEAVVGKPVRFRINNPPRSNDAWVGIYPTSLKDNDHGKEGDRWKWLKDIDLDSASFPEQSEGRWSIRVFKDRGYAVVSRLDFEILQKGEMVGRLTLVSWQTHEY